MDRGSPIPAWAVAALVGLAGCGTGSGPAAPGSEGTALFQFDGSQPPPGSEVRVEQCDGFCTTSLTLRFLGASAQPFAVSIELLGANGSVCATALVTPPHSSAQPSAFETDLVQLEREPTGAWRCAPPARVTRLRARMTGAGSVPLAALDVPVVYTFELRSAPARETAPRIANLCWDAPGPSGGCGHSDAPFPDEIAGVSCIVEDSDGDALEVTLRAQSAAGGFLADGGGLVSSVTSRFAPWPFPRNVSAGFVSQVPTVATITCEAVDADGRTATAEVCLPIGSGGCG